MLSRSNFPEDRGERGPTLYQSVNEIKLASISITKEKENYNTRKRIYESLSNFQTSAGGRN